MELMLCVIAENFPLLLGSVVDSANTSYFEAALADQFWGECQ